MKYKIKNGAIVLKGNAILDEVNFEINDGEHVGIVGRNGAGKTTLIKALIDNEMFESGLGYDDFEIQKIGNFKIGYQSQITFDDENITLLDEIKKSFSELVRLENKIEEKVKSLEYDSSSKNVIEYSELLERYENLGGYTYKKEYEVMLYKFGFKEEEKERPISSFSGGERTKIAFIKLLLSKPDLLFLDEPTNHLDVDAIVWLEEYLKNYKGAFVIVSHDRMFLNNTVGIIYDISNKVLTRYVGDYEHYEKERRENYEKALKDYERQKKEIARLRELYEKFRYKPTKASMALSRLHAIERMEILDKPSKIDEKTFRMNLDKIEPSSKNVVTLKNVSIGYPGKVLASITLDVQKGQRIAVIGANGTGKSTLIKTIAGVLKPLNGHVQYGFNVKVGYFDQTLEFSDVENTVLEEFLQSYPDISNTDARKVLGSFLFKGEDVFKKIKVLSGGEKVALLLCKLLYDKPNFLLLDEPTNHMDIVGKERLEDILSLYKGTIVFISHDRYFVKKVATDILAFENGSVNFYRGGYDEYIIKRTVPSPVLKNNSDKVKVIKKTGSKPNHYEEKKEFRKVETEITRLETRKKEINAIMLEDFSDYVRVGELNRELNDIDWKLEELNKEWEKLADIIYDG